MQIAAVLAVVTVAVNIFFIWYSKKCNKAKTDESSNPNNGSSVLSKGYLSSPEAKRLRKSAAAELGMSIEELDRRLVKEIKSCFKSSDRVREHGAGR